VNNLHITTFYVSSQSSSTCRTCRLSRARRVARVSSRAVRRARHSQKAWARHVERVESCRVETWRAKWHLGYNPYKTIHRDRCFKRQQKSHYLNWLLIPIHFIYSCNTLLWCCFTVISK